MFNKCDFYIVRKPRVDVLVTGGAFFGRQARYYGKYCHPWTLISDQSPYVRMAASRSCDRPRGSCIGSPHCTRARVCACTERTYDTRILREWGCIHYGGARPRASPALSILVYREFLKAPAPATRLHIARGETTGKRTGKEIRTFLARFLCARGGWGSG